MWIFQAELRTWNKLALFLTIVVTMLCYSILHSKMSFLWPQITQKLNSWKQIVITLVRIDRWTKYYFGPRIGQSQAEGKNHVCQGGLFKASPHYTVSYHSNKVGPNFRHPLKVGRCCKSLSNSLWVHKLCRLQTTV